MHWITSCEKEGRNGMADHEIILDNRASFFHFCVKRKNEGKATQLSIGKDSTTLGSWQQEDGKDTLISEW